MKLEVDDEIEDPDLYHAFDSIPKLQNNKETNTVINNYHGSVNVYNFSFNISGKEDKNEILSMFQDFLPKK